MNQVERFEKEKIGLLDDQSKLTNLYEIVLIDSNGELIPFYPDDPNNMRLDMLNC